MASDHKTLARCSDAHLMDVQIRGLDNMGVSICALSEWAKELSRHP
jgi:hypothetical protein